MDHSQTVHTNQTCGCLGRFRRKRRKPSRRFGHVAVTIPGYMIIWGGGMHGGLFLEERYIPSNEIWVYQTDTEKWYQLPCEGEWVPPGTSGASAVVVNNVMYVIGGLTGNGNSNELWALDLRLRYWHRINIKADLHKPSPRDKFAAWEHDNSSLCESSGCKVLADSTSTIPEHKTLLALKGLYIFGGFGLPTQGYLHEHGDFYVDANTWQPVRGWNNQLLRFDLASQTWHNPVCHGDVPTPRAAHSAAKLGNYVYVFGGRHCNKRLNDLYRLDLKTLTWTWLSCDLLVTDGRGGSSLNGPCARSWHTFTAISPSHVFLYGGYGQDGDTLCDAWFLDVDALAWFPLSLSLYKPRLWHSAVCTSDGDVLVFGGCCNDILHPSEPTVHTNDLLIFRCSPKSLLRLCLDCAFVNRDKLEGQFSCLPKPLAEVLRLRSGGDPNHFPHRLTGGGAKTCSIS